MTKPSSGQVLLFILIFVILLALIIFAVYENVRGNPLGNRSLIPPRTTLPPKNSGNISNTTNN